MEFNWEDHLVRLQGEPLLQVAQVHFHQLKRLSETPAISDSFQLLSLTAALECNSRIHGHSHWLSSLVDRYKDVFVEPQALPPFRDIDHKIHLVPHSQPVNVKPYRYPHSQKNEIEKVVTDIFHCGVIRPSQSPFSFPVLLVKKKTELGSFALIIEPLTKLLSKTDFKFQLLMSF